MRFFTLLLCVLFLYTTNAQTIIWGGPGDANGEFEGGLNDWTVNAISDPDALWIWEADGAANQGAYFGARGPIVSASVGNGAITFDSDFYDNAGIVGNFGLGIAPATQVGELISPTFSTVGYDKISLTWTQYTRNFNSNYQIGITNDNGVTWTIIELIDNNNIPTNAESATDSKVLINLPESMGNQPEVRFKFIYNADYYFWVIDDVAVVEAPDVDLNMVNMYYPMNSFATPSSMQNADTLQFAAEIINNGKLDVTDGVATCTILQGATPIYNFSQDFTLASGDTIFLVFDDEVMPEDVDFAEGLYSIVYEVSTPSGTDANENNNGLGENFEINTNNYAVNDGNTGGISYNSFDFAAATVVRTGDLPADMEYKASIITAAAATNPTGTMNNRSYTTYVFKVLNSLDQSIEPIFESPNFGDAEDHPNLEYVGYAILDDTGTGVANYAPLSTELFNSDDDEGIVFEPNSVYLVTVQWDFDGNADNGVFPGISNRIYWYQNSAAIFIPGSGWFVPQTEDRVAWNIALTIDAVPKFVNTEEKVLAENVVSVYPNPASDVTNVELTFETPTDAAILLRDAKGTYINSKSVTNATNEKVEFNVSDLPSGAYSFEVRTSNNEVSIKKFIVVK